MGKLGNRSSQTSAEDGHETDRTKGGEHNGAPNRHATLHIRGHGLLCAHRHRWYDEGVCTSTLPVRTRRNVPLSVVLSHQIYEFLTVHTSLMGGENFPGTNLSDVVAVHELAEYDVHGHQYYVDRLGADSSGLTAVQASGQSASRRSNNVDVFKACEC